VLWVVAKIFMGVSLVYLIGPMIILCSLRWGSSLLVLYTAIRTHDSKLKDQYRQVEEYVRKLSLDGGVGVPQNILDQVFERSNSITDPLSLLKDKWVTSEI
jgi:hypothetical protein